MEYITCLVFGILFIVIGAVFATGKLVDHIPAWKATPQEEKDKIDIKALCLNIGGVIAVGGIIFLAGGLWPLFLDKAFTFVMVAWLIGAGFDLYFIQKSSRFKKR